MTFYPDASLKDNEVGLKGYYPKPYILVARDGTEKVTGVSIVYLPDMEHPVYAKARAGIGSSNLTLGFSNGIITSFGQQTDTKVAETIAALGGFDVSLATAKKLRREAGALEQQDSDLGKHADSLRSVAKDIRDVLADDNAKVLTETQRRTLNLKAKDLDGGPPLHKGGLAAAFEAPGSAANAENYLENLVAIIKAIQGVKAATENLSESAKKVWEKIRAIQANLGKILEDIKPKSDSPPAMTLYEVLMVNGITTLREVSFGKK